MHTRLSKCCDKYNPSTMFISYCARCGWERNNHNSMIELTLKDIKIIIEDLEGNNKQTADKNYLVLIESINLILNRLIELDIEK